MPVRFKSGRLRHAVDVWRKNASTTDSDGQPFVPVKVRKQVPCEVKVTGGREAEIAHQNVPVVTYTVTLYQSAQNPITEDCWLDWKGRKLQVEFVPPTAREDEVTELVCTEEVGR